jgi:hypothetical protein
VDETVEGTEHLEDVEERLDAPSVQDWERSEYEDICIDVLVEGTEHGIDHTKTNVVNLDPDSEEFIFDSMSVLVDGTHDRCGASLFEH